MNYIAVFISALLLATDFSHVDCEDKVDLESFETFLPFFKPRGRFFGTLPGGFEIHSEIGGKLVEGWFHVEVQFMEPDGTYLDVENFNLFKVYDEEEFHALVEHLDEIKLDNRSISLETVEGTLQKMSLFNPSKAVKETQNVRLMWLSVDRDTVQESYEVIERLKAFYNNAKFM